jgi:phospholipid/cholesterol/gamma-HCH transport system permease protein
MIVNGTGSFFLFMWQVVTSLRFSPPRFSDILEQTLAALRLGWRPIVATTFPFGMAFAFNFDSLLGVIGARPFAGGAVAPSVIRQAGSLVSAMTLTAVVGAAFCADLGARKVRDEVAAHEVMSVNPLPRLVIPRMVALTFITPIMYFFASASAVMGGFILLVLVRGANAGLFLNGMQTLVQPADIYFSVIKAVIFGLEVGALACYFGFQATGGPSGVATKVRSMIITSTVVVFITDFALTTAFYAQ